MSGRKFEGDVDFSLIYQGPLPSATGDSTRSKDKQRIRRLLHPQLAELWKTHPILNGHQADYLREGKMNRQRQLEPVGLPEHELCGALYWRLGGFRFQPLVTNWLSLVAAVSVDFFRQGRPGDLVHGGDLDNRMKTLLDALRMPRDIGELAGDVPEQPEQIFYTVLEDDSLIARLTVETNQLLAPILPDAKRSDVWLRIRVTATPTSSHIMSVGL